MPASKGSTFTIAYSDRHPGQPEEKGRVLKGGSFEKKLKIVTGKIAFQYRPSGGSR